MACWHATCECEGGIVGDADEMTRRSGSGVGCPSRPASLEIRAPPISFVHFTGIMLMVSVGQVWTIGTPPRAGIGVKVISFVFIAATLSRAAMADDELGIPPYMLRTYEVLCTNERELTTDE